MNNPDDYQDTAGESVGLEDIPRLLKTMLADMAGLLVVEARLFGHTLRAIVRVTVFLGLLLITGWLSAAGALVVALSNLDSFSLAGALLAVAAGHMVLAALAYWRLRVIMRDLAFRESRASMNSLLTHARSIVDSAGAPPE